MRSSVQIMHLEGFGRNTAEFVRIHEGWAAPIIFTLAFAESLAFLSLILPSSRVLLRITFAGQPCIVAGILAMPYSQLNFGSPFFGQRFS